MKIIILTAMTKRGVIGKDSSLPWHISKELAHFKKVTLGKPVIMGRRTFDSLKRKALPGRDMIILSKSIDAGGDFRVAHTPQEALALAGSAQEVIVAGGTEVYAQFLPMADEIIRSIIHDDYEGNVYFPEIDPSAWRLLSEEVHDEFTVQVLQRVYA